MTACHWRLLPVQLPVPPPAPPVPPPGAPVPPPAPLPGPLTPVLPLDEPGLCPRPLLPEGSLGLLLSGSRVELRVAPGAVPVAPGPSPDAASVARDVADNHPAMSSEVIFLFIMVVSRDESLPDVSVKGHAVGADPVDEWHGASGGHRSMAKREPCEGELARESDRSGKWLATDTTPSRASSLPHSSQRQQGL